MSREDEARSKLLRWLQNIVVVLVIGLLTMKLLNMGFFKDRWGWQSAEREVLLKRFNQNLALAKTEWLVRGKPAQVSIRVNKTRFELRMNAFGWPAIDNGCVRLWRMLAGNVDNLSAEALSDGCRFELDNAKDNESQPLIYNARNGTIK